MQAQVIDRQQTGYDERFQYVHRTHRVSETARERNIAVGRNVAVGMLLARMVSASIAACVIMAAVVGGLCAYTENIEVANKITNYEISRADEAINELQSDIERTYNSILINGQTDGVETEIADSSYFVTDTETESGG
jgi:hypothetical protein